MIAGTTYLHIFSLKKERTSRARVSLIGETITQKGQEETRWEILYFYLKKKNQKKNYYILYRSSLYITQRIDVTDSYLKI
jgi:hypothetical protein